MNSLNLSDNIAVVASSDALLDKEYGELIDSYDQVVRFNNAITEGYEKHVGSRTDMRISNPHVFDDHPDHHIHKIRPGSISYRMEQGIDENYILVHANLYRQQLLHKILNEGIEDCPTALEITKEYTVGTSLVLLCVISNIVPNLFGFSLNMERRGTHYWQKREPPNTDGHSPTLEQKLILELEQAKKIKIYR